MSEREQRALDAVRRLEGARAHAWLVDALGGSPLVWRDRLVEVEPHHRALILFGVSTWTRRPLQVQSNDELPPLEEVVSVELLARWAERSLEAGNTHSVLRALHHHRDAGQLLPVVVRALLDRGLVTEARAEIEATHWTTKSARARAVLELVRAGIATVGDIFAVVTDTPFVQTGHARGGDELDALIDVLAVGATWLPAEAVEALVKAATGLAARGQHTTRPTGFATLLARGSRSCAERAGADSPHVVEAAERLCTAIVFDDVRATVTPTLEQARVRVLAGGTSSVADAEPTWPDTPPEPVALWKVEVEPRLRVPEANRAIVRALDHDDADAFFGALAIAIAPVGPTSADRLRAWQTAAPCERGAHLLDLLVHDVTPDNRWCVLGSHEPWQALADLDDREMARVVLELAFERDFVTRAYAVENDWRRPRSIAAELTRLALRHDLEDFFPRLLSAMSTSTRPGAFHRLFDALTETAASPYVEAELDAYPTLPSWLGWALVSRVDASLDELHARFGAPPPELLHRVCELLARNGRVDDAIAFSAHPSGVHTFANGYEQPRPPPTQDALLTIARNATLTEKQRKKLLGAFKKAPRKRGDGHAERLAKLQELLDRG